MGLAHIFNHCFPCVGILSSAAPARSGHHYSKHSLPLENFDVCISPESPPRAPQKVGVQAGAANPFGTRTSASSAAAELRRLATAVAAGEAGAALQLQRLCDLLRSKTGVSFACVDVFGQHRPCSCTLAASGCAEAALPLGLPRLHTPAEAAEARVVLPPAPPHSAAGGGGGGTLAASQCYGSNAFSSSSASGYYGGTMSSAAACTLYSTGYGGAWSAGGGGGGGARTSASSALFSSSRTTPASPPQASRASSAMCGSRRASAGMQTVPASPCAAGGGGGVGGSPYRGLQPAAAALLPERWSMPHLQERWSSGAAAAAADPRLDGRTSVPTAASLAAILYGADRSSAPSVVGGGGASERGSSKANGGGAAAGACSSSSNAAAAAAAAAFTATLGAAGAGGAPPRCLYGTCPEALPLPRHVRRLAQQFEAELRSFWVLPLLAPSAAGVGPEDEQEVVGVLYLMGCDEQLFDVPRDTVEQFGRWMCDAVGEGQLRLLADLADCMAHAAGPEAAVAAAAAHLSDFFTHRTQDMAEVLAYPAFLPREDPSSTVIMLPPSANRLVARAAAGCCLPPPPPPRGPSVGGSVAISPSHLTSGSDGGLGDCGRDTSITAAAEGDAGVGAAAAAAAGGDGSPRHSDVASGAGGGPPSWLGSADTSEGAPSGLPMLEPFAIRGAETLLLAAAAAGASRGQRLRPPHSTAPGSRPSASDASLTAAAGHRDLPARPHGSRPPLPPLAPATLTRRACAYAVDDAAAAPPLPEPGRPPGAAAPAAAAPPLPSAAPRRYPELMLLPGQPRFVLAGAFRDATPAAALATAVALADGLPVAAIAPPQPAATAMGLYLSFSESLRADLIRELQATLDALLVLLGAAFGRSLGGPEMRRQLEDLMRGAQVVA